MPKVNVYLPDELAEAVRQTGVPVSKICQRALEQAVRDVRTQTASGLTPTFERFTTRARTVVRLAKEAAEVDGVDLGSEHVLLGLVNEGEGVGAKALAALGVTADAVTTAIKRRSSTADGAEVLRRALNEALKLAHNYIGTEHIALAMTELVNSTARDILNELGVTTAALRNEVISILTSITKPASVTLEDVVARLERLEKRLSA